MSLQTDLHQAVAQVTADSALLHTIVHGTAAQTVTTPQGDSFGFDITEHRKHCLLNGLDEIGLTLRHADEIRAFEDNRRQTQPWLFR